MDGSRVRWSLASFEATNSRWEIYDQHVAPNLTTSPLETALTLLSHFTDWFTMRINDFRTRYIALALMVFGIFGILYYQAPLSHLSPLPQRGHQEGHTGGAVLTGHAIAPKLGNATAKYGLQGQGHICAQFGGAGKSSTDRSIQGRTRSRGVEGLAYNICSLPRKAYG